jgi:hypothetical protein
MRFADHPTALSDPSTGLVAIGPERVVAMVRNGGRNQSERLVAINRNRWSQSLGARSDLNLLPLEQGAAKERPIH